MNWAAMSLREFQAALASSSPTPGGGTAAAVALGQAAALRVGAHQPRERLEI